MVSCDICGEQVKNTQALGGHKRFKHGEGYRSEIAPMAGPGTVAVTPKDLQSLAAGLQEMLCALNETIEGISRELVDIKSLVTTPMAQPHPVGLCFNDQCPACPAQAQNMAQLGRNDLDAEHRAIPEVKAALDREEFLRTDVDAILREVE